MRLKCENNSCWLGYPDVFELNRNNFGSYCLFSRSLIIQMYQSLCDEVS